ncbi:MAG: HlyD family efflux transporter periplasmic adaptor subunit [Steroidobacteraceae bacterium]
MADVLRMLRADASSAAGVAAAAPPVPRVRDADRRFVSALHEALLDERDPRPAWLLWTIAALLLVALCWAAASRVEEIAKGNARIVPSSREQVIQSLEGGILQELLVHEGDVVRQGQALLRIDPTKADASFREGRSKRLALRAAAARLAAESRGTSLAFPADVAADRALVENETRTYRARRQALADGVGALERSRQLLAREIAMTAPMVERGLVAEVELLRMKRQANDLELQLAERQNRYRADAAADPARVEAELAQVSDLLTARKDQVDRTWYARRCAADQEHPRHTIGGVIQPGQDIMEIVPLDERLLVEARIAPRDVAFIRPGLPARIKLTAYDYTIYGALDGRVDVISADTLRDERRGDEENYYRVLIRTEGPGLQAGGRPLPIIPGMTATAEIRTGEKSVLSYLLKPVLRSREALRER